MSVTSVSMTVVGVSSISAHLGASLAACDKSVSALESCYDIYDRLYFARRPFKGFMGQTWVFYKPSR